MFVNCHPQINGLNILNTFYSMDHKSVYLMSFFWFISNLHFCFSLSFSPVSILNQGYSRETSCLVTGSVTHTHTHTTLSLHTSKHTVFFLCVSVGSLAGGIQNCLRWSRCCSISSHQSSPTLLPTSSTSALETTRSNLRYWSQKRKHTKREGL